MTSADPAGPSRAKATLFCQTCGHENPITGDWTVRSTAGRTTTRCPECRTVVDERPVGDQPELEADLSTWQTVRGFVERSLESVSASFALSTLLLDPRP